MEELRLERINQIAPYKVKRDPEKPFDFYLVSDNGTRFDVDFTPNDAVIPSGAYEISISNKKNSRSPLDTKLRQTLFAIIEEFFEQNNEVMLYMAETGDEKQGFRNRLFVRWFNTYERRDRYFMRTAEGKMEGQNNFMAIISRLDNPQLEIAISEFDETVELLFD